MIAKFPLKNKKILIGVVVLVVILAGIGIYVVFNQNKNEKPLTLAEQEKVIQDQILKIDTGYRQKMNAVSDKQKQNKCIELKNIEMTSTATGKKTTEQQWQTISVAGICGDLQKQIDDLAKERSFKTSQLQLQLDALTARPESEREKAMSAIRTFMAQPNLQLIYMGTRHPSNFTVGKITSRDTNGYTMDDVVGWERKVEVYQQKEFIDDQCEVYEYEVDVRNNQIVEVHLRVPESVPATPSERLSLCSSYGSMGWPVMTKDQTEQAAFAYLGRDAGHTSIVANSSIQPQYIPSKEGILTKPAQNEWRWEDKSYKLPEGLTSEPFPYPTLRIIMTSGGKLLYYFNSTGLFN